MSLQFNLFSYLIITAFYLGGAVLLAGLWWLFRPWQPIKKVLGVLALLIALAPWADELWIAWRFQQACEDAGVYVTRQVAVEGYLDATKNDPSTENKRYNDPGAVQRMSESGFRYIERRTQAGKTRHLEVQDGMMEQTILDSPESRYHLVHTHDHTSMGYQLVKHEMVVVDSDRDEVIGRDTSYGRYPSFVNRLWIKRYGTGVSLCDGPLDEPEKSKRSGMINDYVLTPIKLSKE